MQADENKVDILLWTRLKWSSVHQQMYRSKIIVRVYELQCGIYASSLSCFSALQHRIRVAEVARYISRPLHRQVSDNSIPTEWNSELNALSENYFDKADGKCHHQSRNQEFSEAEVAAVPSADPWLFTVYFLSVLLIVCQRELTCCWLFIGCSVIALPLFRGNCWKSSQSSFTCSCV